MSKKRIIQGLKNSQRIRVIVNGVGFYTTVLEATQLPFTEQRIAVWNALEVLGREKIQGFGGQTKVYNEKMKAVNIDFQVNLL